MKNSIKILLSVIIFILAVSKLTYSQSDSIFSAQTTKFDIITSDIKFGINEKSKIDTSDYKIIYGVKKVSYLTDSVITVSNYKIISLDLKDIKQFRYKSGTEIVPIAIVGSLGGVIFGSIIGNAIQGSGNIPSFPLGGIIGGVSGALLGGLIGALIGKNIPHYEELDLSALPPDKKKENIINWIKKIRIK